MGTTGRMQHKVTATVYDKRGRILSTATNSYKKTHPWQAELADRAGHPEKKYLHAEVLALLRCKGDPYKIKVERVNRRGQLRLAKPCPICELAIKEAGVRFVEYSVDNAK